jgi:capsular exopolysaccharide synthesis family protein
MAQGPLSLIDCYTLESGLATEFRRVLHNLQNIAKSRELKTIMVTSSTLSEGKSTVSSFLALTAARKGMKTLLVDADLRRPSIHKLFRLNRDSGLSEFLSEGVAAKAVIKKTQLEKLDIITSGKANPIPSEIFDAGSIGRLLGEMKFYYDLVIVDCAPVIPVSDPMLLAHEVDGVLFVVRAGVTQRDVVRRASEILATGTNKVLGVVLNNTDASLPHYFSQDYYGYDYSAQTKAGSEKNESEKSRDKGKGQSPSTGKNESAHKNTLPR